MELNFKKVGESGKELVILHGLFGSLDNWMTLAKKFGEDYQVYLLDQRNHGQSNHSEQFDYPIMAEDLKEFIKKHQLNQPLILGHSMGGKTAMHFAAKYPELLSKLVIVDIAPVNYPVHHQEILNAMKKVDFDAVERRSDVEDVLKEDIEEAGVRQFLLKNLYWVADGQLDWRFNLKVLSENIEEISAGMQITQTYEGSTLFLSGGKSNYIIEQYHSKIFEFFPNATIKTIQHAGHWVHAEAADDFYIIVNSFLTD